MNFSFKSAPPQKTMSVLSTNPTCHGTRARLDPGPTVSPPTILDDSFACNFASKTYERVTLLLGILFKLLIWDSIGLMQMPQES